MPRVPVYSRQGLKSSYVGAPIVEDKSSSFSSVANDLGDMALNISATKEKTAKTEATNVYYQYLRKANNLEYGDATTRGVRDEYADDPQELPSALTKSYDTLAQEMALGVKNQRARELFLSEASKSVANRQIEWGKEAYRQTIANQVVDLEAIGAGLAESARDVRTPDQASNVMRLIDNAFFSPSVSNLPYKERVKQASKYMDQARENIIAANIERDPVAFAADLKDGKYDEIKLQTLDEVGNVVKEVNFFSSKDKNDALRKSREMAILYQKKAEFNLAVMFGEEGFSLADKFLNSSSPDIASIRKAKFNAEAAGAVKQVQMFNAIEEAAISAYEGEAVTDPTWFNGAMENLVGLTKNKFEGKGFKGKRKVSAEVRAQRRTTPMEKVDRIYDYVREIHEKIARKELTNADAQKLLAVADKEVFRNIGLQRTVPSSYLKGVNVLLNQLDYMAGDMTNAEKQQFKFELLSEYDNEMDSVKAPFNGMDVPEEVMIQTVEKVRKAASYRLWPEYIGAEKGTLVPTKFGARKFMGFGTDGRPLLEFTDRDRERLNIR